MTEHSSSETPTAIYLLSILLWIISAAVGVIAALVIRAALMVFYTDTLARIINPWSIQIVSNILLLVAVLAWLVLAMVGHEYYRQSPTFGTLMKRFAIVTVILGAVVGLGFLAGWRP